jgi:phosphate uptake regulator
VCADARDQIASSEEDMKHAVKNLKENMHDLLESLFEDYARQLRADYQSKRLQGGRIRFCIREFARLGYQNW